MGGLTYTYAASPCLREGAGAGCVTRDGSTCQVAWFYGSPGPGIDAFVEQCVDQGHEAVTP
ncbi:MAG: hypothetical protein KIS78_19455 [Labilithrix sp.]|nr:hypothetical protein [Labilithrix sp.]MCW5834588.1 hypothetical protein [Labilithrix sp.]